MGPDGTPRILFSTVEPVPVGTRGPSFGIGLQLFFWHEPKTRILPTGKWFRDSNAFAKAVVGDTH